MTMRLRYVGGLDKTLVDVANLTFNTEIEVDDALGEKLLGQFAEDFVELDAAPEPEPAPEPAPVSAFTFGSVDTPASADDVTEDEEVDKGVISG